MRLLAILTTAALVLAGCGVEGDPIPPKPKPKTGLTISGTAEIGIKGTL